MAQETTARPSLIDRLIPPTARLVVTLERNASTLLELAGAAVISFGVGMFDVRVGVIVCGVFVALVGVALGRPSGGHSS